MNFAIHLARMAIMAGQLGGFEGYASRDPRFGGAPHCARRGKRRYKLLRRNR